MLVLRTRFMTNRNTLKPFNYPLITTIIAHSKRFIQLKFYQVVRNSCGADVFAGAFLDTDSLQKRMSLSALVPITNWNSQGLKLILYFYAFMI